MRCKVKWLLSFKNVYKTVIYFYHNFVIITSKQAASPRSFFFFSSSSSSSSSFFLLSLPLSSSSPENEKKEGRTSSFLLLLLLLLRVFFFTVFLWCFWCLVCPSNLFYFLSWGEKRVQKWRVSHHLIFLKGGSPKVFFFRDFKAQ